MMIDIDKLRQQIKQFAADFAGFSDVAKFITAIVGVMVIVLAILLIEKYAVIFTLIVILLAVAKIYFIEHTNQIWRSGDARKAVAAVLTSFVNRKYILRSAFKFETLNNVAEKLRTFNRAIYECELSQDEVNLDVFYSDEDVLTFEAQQTWQRYLADNSERSSFNIARVALINKDSYYLLRIVLKDNKHVKMLERNEVYDSQKQDKDFS